MIPAPMHQRRFAGQTIRCFGRDKDGLVDYRFNHLGWRCNHDHYDINDSVIAIGNSLTFGVGVGADQRWTGLLEKHISQPVYNFSVGHLTHSNLFYLQIIEEILKHGTPQKVILQINNLDRVEFHGRWDEAAIWNLDEKYIMDQFSGYWSKIKEYQKICDFIFIYWDDKSHELPNDLVDQLTINNLRRLDDALTAVPDTFGPRSQQLIFTALKNQL